MTIRTVLLGGTNWSDGQILYAADLNDTLAANVSFITRTFSNVAGSTTSGTFQDVVTLSTPAATKASQTVFVRAAVSVIRNAADGEEVQLYDATASTVIGSAVGTATVGTAIPQTVFLQGAVTLASITDTKSIKLQYRRSSGSTSAVQWVSCELTCALVVS